MGGRREVEVDALDPHARHGLDHDPLAHAAERTIYQMRNWWKRFRKTAPERLRAAEGAASASSDVRGKVCRTCGERLSGHVLYE